LVKLVRDLKFSGVQRIEGFGEKIVQIFAGIIQIFLRIFILFLMGLQPKPAFISFDAKDIIVSLSKASVLLLFF